MLNNLSVIKAGPSCEVLICQRVTAMPRRLRRSVRPVGSPGVPSGMWPSYRRFGGLLRLNHGHLSALPIPPFWVSSGGPPRSRRLGRHQRSQSGEEAPGARAACGENTPEESPHASRTSDQHAAMSPCRRRLCPSPAIAKGRRAQCRSIVTRSRPEPRAGP